ncbi:translation initiation factor eIF-2A [Exidia glandulosa HHB12029]|uniref:Eukaryotic translation initiation factor 2A n=1 Tax=Exidia glandulosa HHB12029 TaxID=1314781 RepID=A0A166NM03_EXIGL|nr:translation initiation factor eIF-2A [Exidia glandulosa HHB12029]KZV79788.1 translation initiation factor eIF-2A [Exidia glandulosa HHB12029]
MATPVVHQYAYRAQKAFGISLAAPIYADVDSFPKPDVHVRLFQYSQDGRFFAYALPTSLRILNADSLEVVQELDAPNVVDFNFSPLATFISTWERPTKLEDGAQHKNLRIWSVATGQQVTGFTSKGTESWDVQYTANESHAVRAVSGDVQAFSPANDWQLFGKARVENCTSVSVSPGKNPSVAVFVAEKSGQPASVKVFSILSLSGQPSVQKSFFKADRATIKWNALGTQVLVLTQAEVDKTNKNYYGETGLYLLSAAGNFDARVTLDKEGPVHDFMWSPNSKEFGVTYGYMPAKTVLFDQRLRAVHDFGMAPQNFISFNPQGRLVVLAGFGNLAGKIDVFDRQTLNKVCVIDAPNSSHFEWSPCGKYILTATLSPRLRVDNGIKIWHCTGTLLHTQSVDELYQTGWKPRLVDGVAAPFGNQVPAAPAPSAAVKAALAAAAADGTKSPAPKAAGAYRPPGARGTATPNIYKREDEGGSSFNLASGANTPPSRYGRGSPAPGAGSNGYTKPTGNGVGGRYVPGAPPPAERQDGGAQGGGKKKKQGGGEQQQQQQPREPREPREPKEKKERKPRPAAATDGAPPLDIPAPDPTPEAAGPLSPAAAAELDPVLKKIRNLNKKLKAIDELKEKRARGEKLENTQVRKIDGEAEVRKEIATLTALTDGAAPP